MALTVVYNIPITSVVYSVNVTDFIPRSVLIENHSGDSVIFDNTVDPLLVIPAGVTVPINIGHLIYTLRIRTLTNTTGYVRMTVSDSERDTSNAPILQQLPGGVTIGSAITLAPGTTVDVGNDVTDPVARSYLAALQGLLPQSLLTFAFNNFGGGPGAEQTHVLVNAVTQFSVAFVPAVTNSSVVNGDGLLWIWYSLLGTRFYIENKSYWSDYANGYEDTFLPPWTTYHEYIPAGATFGVGFEGNGTVIVRL